MTITLDPASSAVTITLQYTHHALGLANMAAFTMNLQTRRTAQLLAMGHAPVLSASSHTCNGGTHQQIALPWTAATPPTGRTAGGYALLRTDGTTVAVVGSQATSYTDTSLTMAGPLTHTVQAVYDNLAQGPQSNALVFAQTCV